MMSMISGAATFRWREDDGAFVDELMEELRDLGLRPSISTLSFPTNEQPPMVSHTLSFEVLPALAGRASDLIAGIAEAGGSVLIALNGRQQKGLDQ